MIKLLGVKILKEVTCNDETNENNHPTVQFSLALHFSVFQLILGGFPPHKLVVRIVFRHSRQLFSMKKL